jgi:hypothetical protein
MDPGRTLKSPKVKILHEHVLKVPGTAVCQIIRRYTSLSVIFHAPGSGSRIRIPNTDPGPGQLYE